VDSALGTFHLDKQPENYCNRYKQTLSRARALGLGTTLANRECNESNDHLKFSTSRQKLLQIQFKPQPA